MKTGDMLKQVLSEITSDNGKRKDVESMLSKINKSLKKNKVSAKAMIGGSFAKDVFLKEDHDVDVFVLFSMKYKNDDISKMLEKALKQFKPEKIHGSRDYFKIKNDLHYEIVPVLDIKNSKDAQNVTDFSPAHVKWVNKNGGKYKGDIRIAKKFCKANNVYGAESYINGLSGHVLDILVIHYKGFMGLMKAAAKWKDKQIIDFYNKHKGKALFNLNKSKTEGPLVVVDPVQPERNASAALTMEKFVLFSKTAKQFVKKPSINFFVKKKTDVQELIKKGAVVIDAASVKGKEDIAGTKLLKAFEFLNKRMSDFGVQKAGWEWDKKSKAFFWFIAKEKKLPEYEEKQGPPLSKKDFVADFKKKYKKTYSKKGKVYAKVKRKYRTPESMIKELIKDSYFQERTKGAKIR